MRSKVNSKVLLERYHNLTASPEERAIVEAWYLEHQQQELPKQQEFLDDHFTIKEVILNHTQPKVKKILPSMRSIAAAAIFLVLGFSTLYYFYISNYKKDDRIEFTKDIPAGKNGGSLTLPNGKVISLNTAKNGVVIAANTLSYDDQTPVSNIQQTDIEALAKGKKNESLQLTTANGQTYQLTLPDGTNVWLNASSKLIFPASFVGKAERSVELEGEGYFEVSKSKTQPFKVKTKKQEVKVLGTHFNIHAYGVEPTEVTTLTEGSVNINTVQDQQLLTPNHQATISNSKIELAPANLKYNLAWKNGYFRFNQDDITEIMRRISRWYDIEVVYEGEISQEKFSGTISNSKNISQVLRMLSYSQDIKFKIEGRRVTVTK
jgi:transmembrane sensor